MSPLTPNRLVGDLLDFAESSTTQASRTRSQQVVIRRAISSAYYALFHALCYVCADGLVGWSRKEEFEPIYRSLEHASARRLLRHPDAKALGAAVERVGTTFAELQDLRHEADYSPPGRRFGTTKPFTQKEALAWIRDAREAAEIVGGLDATARRRLAILLIAKQRRT
jgi:uncharacterized protein (UPF0332 family)